MLNFWGLLAASLNVSEKKSVGSNEKFFSFGVMGVLRFRVQTKYFLLSNEKFII